MFEFLRVTGELEEPHNKGVTHIKRRTLCYVWMIIWDNIG